MNIVIRRGMYTWLVLAMVLAGSLASVGQAAGPAGPAKAYFAGGCFCDQWIYGRAGRTPQL